VKELPRAEAPPTSEGESRGGAPATEEGGRGELFACSWRNGMEIP
jgi:hypothetical protein